MSFDFADLTTIGLLVLLEGILSVDNAVVLAILAKRVAPHLRKRALTYGIVGAIGFRFLALAFAAKLMQWTWVKFVGGFYLLYIAIHHWISHANKSDEEKAAKPPLSFWKAVFMIEMMDIAFAVDSILAAVAVSPKLWVVFTGGVIGLVMMRFAASGFVKLLERFPNFEDAAYILIALIGLKLVIDGMKFPQVNFHSSSSPAFWIFWSAMFFAILYGFKKRPNQKKPSKEVVDLLEKEEKIIGDL